MTIATFQQWATICQFVVAFAFAFRGNLKASIGFFVLSIVSLIFTTNPEMWSACH